MKQDRFLLGILIFIGLLVVAALALFFIRQDTQVYVADDTPEGVIRNYALALQKQDFLRAYNYLADKDNKPTYDTFRRAFLTNQLDVSSNALQVGSIQYIDSGEATVNVTVLYAGSGPFTQGWSSTDNAALVQQAGVDDLGCDAAGGDLRG
ncbi:MAG: hypothetical protein NTV38_06945, partial [Chloroflexi bacterium]|nr:hypothetical protein [Chloroflexota bacterium]